MNGQSTFRRWLAGLAVGALLAVLLMPLTSWLVRSQFGYQLGGTVPELVSFVPMPGRELTEPPPIPTPNADDDLPLQLGYALKSANYDPDAKITAVDRLRALKSRFPDSPSLYASILRFATQAEVRVNREEENLLSAPGKSPTFRSSEIAPAVLEQFDSEAAAGERLDPDNAYFPFMRTIGLYAANRDDEALEALSRAAAKPRWDEYIRDEVEGKVRLSERAYGRRPALAKTAIYAAVHFPHYAGLRSSARVSTVKAMNIELSGDSERGYRIRRDVIQMGELIRAHGRSLITNLVGEAISDVALARPGGAPAIEREGTTESAENSAARARNSHTDFFAYMSRIGHGEDVIWLRSLLKTGEDARQGLQDAIDLSGFGGRPMWHLIAWWAANLILLSNSFWLLMVASATLLLSRTTAIRYGRELPAPMIWGVVAAWFGWLLLVMMDVVSAGTLRILSISLLAAIFVVVQRSWGINRSFPITGALAMFALMGLVPIPAVVSVLAGTLAGILCISRDRPASGIAAGIFSFAATAVIGASFFGTAWWLSRGVRSLTYAATSVIGNSDGNAVGIVTDFGGAFAIALFAVPITLGALLVVVSFFNRVPISVGLCRGFRGIAAPSACLLLVAYSASVVRTAKLEEHVSAALVRSLEHEGRYLSELAGKQWPDEVRRMTDDD